MTITPTLVVRHRAGEYPIYVYPGALRDLATLTEQHAPGRKPVVIADSNVAKKVGNPLDAPMLTFPAGEASKSRAEWARLTDELLALGVGRDGVVIALGGGVTGDLAGFVAATYLRGVPVLQVPTTLLAMVDASVGGKTGIDTVHGKNLVGAFHQPLAVVTDPTCLASLPDAELRTGLAEAVKHAIIADRGLFDRLTAARDQFLGRDVEALTELVRANVRIKASVVEEDEREQGRRAILNAGHTIGHAIEAALNYQLSHGEAVAIGLVCEASIAEQMGIASPGTADAIAQLLRDLGLPTTPPPKLPAAVLELMRRDKKNQASAIHCALPMQIGDMAGSHARGWTSPVPEALLRSTLDLN